MFATLRRAALLAALAAPAGAQALPALPSHVVRAAELARAELRHEPADGRPLVGTLQLRPEARQVRVEWAREWRTARPADALGARTYGVRYEPTACVRTGPLTAVVAGRDRWGNAVLERWTFAPPSETGEAKAPAPPELPEPFAVDELFSGNQPGESIVRGLWNAPLGDRPGLLLFFHGTRTVYRFDPAEETFGALAALDGDGALGLLEVPGLADDWWRTGGVLDLPDGSVLYRFERDAAPVTEPNAVQPRDRLYLIDLDGDGWLDAARHWNHADPRHVAFVAEAVQRP